MTITGRIGALCVVPQNAETAVVATLPPAGDSLSPAGVFFAGGEDGGGKYDSEPLVDRYERLTWESMEARLASHRRLLRESREREIEARECAKVLEKCLADMHVNNGTHRCISAVLAVALVFAVFALLA